MFNAVGSPEILWRYRKITLGEKKEPGFLTRLLLLATKEAISAVLRHFAAPASAGSDAGETSAEQEHRRRLGDGSLLGAGDLSGH